MTLSRWDPFRDMVTLRTAMDQLFDTAINRSDRWDQQTEWDLPLDVTENQDEYMVKASIPGVNPDDLEITYNNNMLTIRGEMKQEEEVKGAQYHIRERRFGTFSRTISLPTSVKVDAIQADYQDGILKLHLPKSEDVKPKRIEIQTGRHGTIEAKSTDRDRNRQTK